MQMPPRRTSPIPTASALPGGGSCTARRLDGHLIELSEARPPRYTDADEDDRDAKCPDLANRAGKLLHPSIWALAALLSVVMDR